jgi:two-component system NtrC family sensor kinase
VRIALQRYLEGRGHRVDSTPSGLDAVARLRATRYDAVILDLRIPDLPGEELFRQLREADPDHAARVIFMTGDLLSEHMRAFLEGTGRPLVSKPFELAVFEQALPAARQH